MLEFSFSLQLNRRVLKFLPFVLRHLQRTWIRTASTVVAMALCVLLFCLLQSALARVDGAIAGRSPRRLVTTNVMKMSALPLAYRGRIQGAAGVERVTPMVMFGGFLRGRKEGKADSGSDTDWTTFFHNVAVDAEPYFAMNPELIVAPEQFREFLRDVQGCVIGRTLAEKFGWRLGDRFFLESFADSLRKPDGPFEFVVRGFVDTDLDKYPGTETEIMFFHFAYLDAALGGATRPSLYMVEIDDPRQAAEIGGIIDDLFENSSDQTLTETEQAFLADFISMAGDLSVLLNGIGLAVCFTILLVTANTMSMAVRERRTEIAVLKTLGFTSAQVMGLVVAEALLLGLSGGILGVGGTRGAFWMLDHRPGLMMPGMPALELRLPIALLGLGVAVLLGFAAGFMPAWGAYRARVTEMLRMI
jgi:putative ABC transport system permease protein